MRASNYFCAIHCEFYLGDFYTISWVCKRRPKNGSLMVATSDSSSRCRGPKPDHGRCVVFFCKYLLHPVIDENYGFTRYECIRCKGCSDIPNHLAASIHTAVWAGGRSIAKIRRTIPSRNSDFKINWQLLLCSFLWRRFRFHSLHKFLSLKFCFFRYFFHPFCDILLWRTV